MTIVIELNIGKDGREALLEAGSHEGGTVHAFFVGEEEGLIVVGGTLAAGLEANVTHGTYKVARVGGVVLFKLLGKGRERRPGIVQGKGIVDRDLRHLVLARSSVILLALKDLVASFGNGEGLEDAWESHRGDGGKSVRSCHYSSCVCCWQLLGTGMPERRQATRTARTTTVFFIQSTIYS
ncbi:hypothetical protein BC937DRAFT_94204 [Endogone sp. FLAS-F59071]|nr:hypothetical protein BC937DRAFT_94204 [Endogone sp. FLAS-F59071]|eukprot:RUS14198.1 hypothetical protein BC937DRAFT_94204 [Endogone sp. FLAS-F59071]